MNRFLLLLACVVALLLTGGLLWYSDRQVPPPVAPVMKPTEPPLETVPTVVVPPERRLLEIQGRVVGEKLEPLAEITVFCGEESVETGPDGTFSFPLATRPRSVRVSIQSVGKEIVSWESVLAGDRADPDRSAGRVYALEEVLLPDEPERLYWTINLGAPTSDSDKPSLAESEWIRLERFFIEQWGKGGRIRVSGRTRLPDGAHVATSLYFDGFRFIASLEPAEVRAGSFQAVMMTPLETRLYPGTYEAIGIFSSAFEPIERIEEWSQQRPEEDWSTLVIPQVTTFVTIGDSSEALAGDKSTQEYYGSHLDRVTKLYDDLRARVKVLRRAAKKPEAHFEEAAWRKFLDEDWRPPLESLLSRHASRGVEKYEDARLRMDMLFKTLRSMSYVYSRFVVYPAFGRKPHPNDFYIDEDGSGDLLRMKRNFRENLKKMQRFRFLVPSTDSGTILE